MNTMRWKIVRTIVHAVGDAVLPSFEHSSQIRK